MKALLETSINSCESAVIVGDGSSESGDRVEERPYFSSRAFASRYFGFESTIGAEKEASAKFEEKQRPVSRLATPFYFTRSTSIRSLIIFLRFQVRDRLNT